MNNLDYYRSFLEMPLTPGAFAILPLGQMSFILRIADKCIWLDPFLTEIPGRLVPPLLRPEEAVGADLVTGSHDHADHIDRPALPAIAAASPNAAFVFPEAVRSSVAGIPAERVIGMNDGETRLVNGISVTAIASAHELLDQDKATGLYPYLGFVIEYAGIAVYHSGDCCIYEGLQSKLQRWPQLDAMFLPINGRDAWRFSHDFIGNMTFQEAVDLAGAVRPRLAVPGHFDMFAPNSEDPCKFTDYMKVKYPDVPAWRPVPGVWTVVPPANR